MQARNRPAATAGNTAMPRWDVMKSSGTRLVEVLRGVAVDCAEDKAEATDQGVGLGASR